MDTVTLKWVEGVFKFPDLEDSKNNYLNNSGFYAIIAGKYNKPKNHYEDIKLLYIGQAYDQDLRTRISQEHVAYECVDKYLKNNTGTTPLIKIGIVFETSLSRKTQELFDDIESCLISTNQPRCNTQEKSTYDGRVIKITNEGDFFPLKEDSSCGEYRI